MVVTIATKHAVAVLGENRFSYSEMLKNIHRVQMQSSSDLNQGHEL